MTLELGEEWEKSEALQRRRLHYLEQNVNRNMDFKSASGDLSEESEEDRKESFCLDSKKIFMHHKSGVLRRLLQNVDM